MRVLETAWAGVCLLMAFSLSVGIFVMCLFALAVAGRGAEVLLRFVGVI